MAPQGGRIPELDRAGLRRFALANSAVVATLFGIVLPWLFDFDWPLWPWLVAAVLSAWGLLAPASLRPVYRGWMRFALVLNRIVTPVIMGVVYYLVITPTGLIRRLVAADPMARETDDTAETYRVPSRKPGPDSLERPF